MYFQSRVLGYGYIAFIQLLARKAMDPHSWGCTIHSAPKIKFVTERQLVSIAAEEDMIAATSSGAPYVEADEKALECSFRSLEFVNAMYVEEGAKVLVPRLSENTHIVRKYPFRHKASARQRRPSRKGIREKATRHAEADHGDPEDG